MDAAKLEISGKDKEQQSPSATYKQIPEDDMEEPVLQRPKSLIKSTSNEADGADEKMLPREEKKVSPNSNVNVAEVKFINNEKQNGDAKLDIGEIKSEFVGMTKEELMKYANDPFWIRLRWFLFILFWLVWLGMLVGAVMIIVVSPKCAPLEPKTWWEQGPLVELEDTNNADIDELVKSGVSGLIIPYPNDTYEPVNGSDAFLNFLQLAKSKDMKVIVELVPGVSDMWFEKSENKDDEYKDYYIWHGREGVTAESKPPNNWLAVDSKDDNKISAWKFSPTRKQFYLKQTDKPQLNFRLPAVLDKFTNVLTSFLDAGANGIRLKGAPNLLVDALFADELVRAAASDYSQSNYHFYTHTKTENLLQLGPILKKWHDLVKNKTGDGVFMLAEDLSTFEPYKVNNTAVIDLPKQSQVFTESQLTATKLKDGIDAVYRMFDNNWPLWKVKGTGDIPEDALFIVAFLLKGTSIVDQNTHIQPQLKEVRKSPSIIFGIESRYVLANNTVFGYVSVHSGNPGYVVAINPTNDRVVVNFQEETSIVSPKVTLHYHSQNYNETGYDLKDSRNADGFPITAKSAVVLSYVPK